MCGDFNNKKYIELGRKNVIGGWIKFSVEKEDDAFINLLNLIFNYVFLFKRREDLLDS